MQLGRSTIILDKKSHIILQSDINIYISVRAIYIICICIMYIYNVKGLGHLIDNHLADTNDCPARTIDRHMLVRHGLTPIKVKGFKGLTSNRTRQWMKFPFWLFGFLMWKVSQTLFSQVNIV